MESERSRIVQLTPSITLWCAMSRSKPLVDRQCQRLRDRLALNIILDETAISALSEALAVLRDAGDPLVSELEQAVRSHRIGIIKQRAILGAAGIEA